jgi:hypothetical protein
MRGRQAAACRWLWEPLNETAKMHFSIPDSPMQTSQQQESTTDTTNPLIGADPIIDSLVLFTTTVLFLVLSKNAFTVAKTIDGTNTTKDEQQLAWWVRSRGSSNNDSPIANSISGSSSSTSSGSTS